MGRRKGSKNKKQSKKVSCYCIICNKFIGKYFPSVLRQTCSKECYRKFISKQTKGEKNPNYKGKKWLGTHVANRCPHCGELKVEQSKYCKKCRMNFFNPFKGKKHSKSSLEKIGRASKKMWKEKQKEIEGRKHKDSLGYIKVLNYSHPNSKYNHVFEHVLIMSKQLGRPIKSEERIHHINGDKTDNRIENLYLCSDLREHQNVHHSLDKLLKYLLENKAIKFQNGRYCKGG